MPLNFNMEANMTAEASFDRRAIADPAQIRLLSSPVRQELVDTLAALGGEASVAALAGQVGRPADGLYYHLRALVRGGLLVEVEQDGERVYRFAGAGDSPLRLAYRLGADGNSAEIAVFARSLLQIASRDFEAALKRSDSVVEGPDRELWASRNKGWLAPEDIVEVNTLLERLSQLTSQPKAPARTQLASCTFVLAPVDARPPRRATAASLRGDG